eukprot:6555199-Prymnesium_polylepis.1
MCPNYSRNEPVGSKKTDPLRGGLEGRRHSARVVGCAEHAMSMLQAIEKAYWRGTCSSDGLGKIKGVSWYMSRMGTDRLVHVTHGAWGGYGSCTYRRMWGHTRL